MEKKNLKHKTEQWKHGASMKNMKEFGVSGWKEEKLGVSGD
jgi:hypothetical protein